MFHEGIEVLKSEAKAIISNSQIFIQNLEKVHPSQLIPELDLLMDNLHFFDFRFDHFRSLANPSEYPS